MAISKDLMLSILAMDAYNRGEGAAIKLTGDQIGTVNIGANSDELLGNPNDTSGNPTPAQQAGFFAVQYTIGTGVTGLAAGKTIISYDGTDNAVDITIPFFEVHRALILSGRTFTRLVGRSAPAHCRAWYQGRSGAVSQQIHDQFFIGTQTII